MTDTEDEPPRQPDPAIVRKLTETDLPFEHDDGSKEFLPTEDGPGQDEAGRPPYERRKFER